MVERRTGDDDALTPPSAPLSIQVDIERVRARTDDAVKEEGYERLAARLQQQHVRLSPRFSSGHSYKPQAGRPESRSKPYPAIISTGDDHSSLGVTWRTLALSLAGVKSSQGKDKDKDKKHMREPWLLLNCARRQRHLRLSSLGLSSG